MFTTVMHIILYQYRGTKSSVPNVRPLRVRVISGEYFYSLRNYTQILLFFVDTQLCNFSQVIYQQHFLSALLVDHNVIYAAFKKNESCEIDAIQSFITAIYSTAKIQWFWMRTRTHTHRSSCVNVCTSFYFSYV